MEWRRIQVVGICAIALRSGPRFGKLFQQSMLLEPLIYFPHPLLVNTTHKNFILHWWTRGNSLVIFTKATLLVPISSNQEKKVINFKGIAFMSWLLVGCLLPSLVYVLGKIIWRRCRTNREKKGRKGRKRVRKKNKGLTRI